MSSFKLPQAPEFRFSAEREMRAAIRHLRLLPIDDMARLAAILSTNLASEGSHRPCACLGALAATIESIHVALDPEK